MIKSYNYVKISKNVCKRARGIHVTVCIAAICENDSVVICASDRMLTAGDIEFEPQKSKITLLTNSIIAMIAGDSSLQTDILQMVNVDIAERIKSNPLKWLQISEVADLYVQYYNKIKLKMAENAILAPLNLDSTSFIANQKQMDHQLIEKLVEQMTKFAMEPIEVIFAGIDMAGAHIHVVHNYNFDCRSECRDRVGFASIGIGSRHANSEFMFAGHTGSRMMPETLLLTYSAKKRAEAAPGVGSATDMCFIGPTLGGHYFPKENEDVFKQLKDIYGKAQENIRRSNIKANKEIDKYVQDLVEATVKIQKETQAKAEIETGSKPTT